MGIWAWIGISFGIYLLLFVVAFLKVVSTEPPEDKYLTPSNVGVINFAAWVITSPLWLAMRFAIFDAIEREQREQEQFERRLKMAQKKEGEKEG